MLGDPFGVPWERVPFQMHSPTSQRREREDLSTHSFLTETCELM